MIKYISQIKIFLNVFFLNHLEMLVSWQAHASLSFVSLAFHAVLVSFYSSFPLFFSAFLPRAFPKHWILLFTCCNASFLFPY